METRFNHPLINRSYYREITTAELNVIHLSMPSDMAFIYGSPPSSFIKRIVHPKKKISCLFSHPQYILHVQMTFNTCINDFLSSAKWEERFRDSMIFVHLSKVAGFNMHRKHLESKRNLSSKDSPHCLWCRSYVELAEPTDG